MSNFAIIRVERLKTMGNVKASALHTFREIETGNAISEKFDDNEFVGAKDAEGVYQAVFARIDKIEKKDKQATRCLEFFISASPEQFAENGALHDQESQKRFFDESLNFIKNKHGAENVVFHAIHRDEKSPHMVVYAVPVVHREAHTRKRSVGVKGGGRTLKEEFVPAANELSAKAYYHCPAALSLLQDDFHAGVGKGFGLDRGISRVQALKNKRPAKWYAEQQALLDARTAAIALKEKELEALRAELKRREDDLAADQVVLSYEQGALLGERKRLTAELHNRGLELDQERDRLAAVKIELDSKEIALSDKGAALDQREDNLFAQVQAVTLKETSLSMKETDLRILQGAIATDMKNLETNFSQYSKDRLQKNTAVDKVIHQQRRR